ncbi:carboxymuconolactone decarboxylase family protein [Altererythrobacter salegens]|uniref:Carboxymuconolactone decarboxylase family protein n=1 Tax=Croceibacterium salegens TaxID=1737568 RepID=A0A6I4SZ69_9SPHN|nr:carboxymuconolactone decarboxylase family protein [Croceibacterium salegens]MXO61281.1 carboxymuconolactone decarboxylase family protein [Croceibacterium salegens]
MPDSYLAGLEVLASVGIDQDDFRNRAAEVAPEFVRLAIGFTYGEIFNRPGLDLKVRMLVAIAAGTATGTAPGQLREHVQAALRLGWSEREIIEVMIQTAAHSGVPAALTALTDCHDLLAVRTRDSESCYDESSETGQA